MKYLAIDYGQKRTGIAVTDTGGSMAFPNCTLVLKPQKTRDAFMNELATVIVRETPAALVVGLPLTLAGEVSLTTRQVHNFVKQLKRVTKLPIYWMEELLSSFEAESDLREAGCKSSKMKAVTDQQAAVRILQSFLAQPEGKRKLA